jgi:manganese transport protein
MGKPEDSKTLFYKISIFATAIPSFIIIAMGLDTYKILILSQVILSIQLPFTLIPLLILCKSKKIMGNFRSKTAELAVAAAISAVIIGLNVYLLYSTLFPGRS